MTGSEVVQLTEANDQLKGITQLVLDTAVSDYPAVDKGNPAGVGAAECVADQAFDEDRAHPGRAVRMGLSGDVPTSPGRNSTQNSQYATRP